VKSIAAPVEIEEEMMMICSFGLFARVIREGQQHDVGDDR
jgi:hypothetical protein